MGRDGIISPRDGQPGLDDVLTPDEAAAYLKLSKKTLLRHARQGTLPAAKVGHVWRFRREDLLSHLGAKMSP